MEDHGFFTDHYEVFLIAANIVLMTMVILFMVLSTAFPISLLIASALFLVSVFHSNRGEEPPCGSRDRSPTRI